MKFSLYFLILTLFISTCTTTKSYEYEIFSNDGNKNIDTKLVIDVRKELIRDQVTINVQSFPKSKNNIKNYEIIFDMKFREDYNSDSTLCIGPAWDVFGPGEFLIQLNEDNNFKNNIKGSFEKQVQIDECIKYFYYLRYFVINLKNGDKILTGVATDYAEEYPDAPYFWQIEKNIIDKNGSTNISKYSLYFELSR